MVRKEGTKKAKAKQEFNVVDLFSGAGGLSYGFEKAGMNVLLGIDNDEDAINTFAKNHKNAKALCADMTKVSVAEVKKLCSDKKIHVIVGGPPCQGFSMAGKRQPNDPRNSLFREFIRLVNGIRPDVCVMENVRGLLSMKTENNKSVIDIILEEFKDMNYIVDVNKVNTADYGVSQKRHRIFIVARKKRIKFNFPPPTHSETGTTKEGKNIRKWTGLKKIILPRKEVDEKYFYSDKLIKGFIRRQKNNKKRGMGLGWKFLDKNKPSYTISARYYKDGAEALIKYDKKSIRMLTQQECAQIQSFPKSFKFSGNKINIYKQIGNAVPPMMAKHIGKSVLKSLGDKYGKR